MSQKDPSVDMSCPHLNFEILISFTCVLIGWCCFFTQKKNVATYVVGVGPTAKNHEKDMQEIAGDEGKVLTYKSFSKLSEKFLKDFIKDLCGKLQKLRQAKFWNHVAIFMIK